MFAVIASLGIPVSADRSDVRLVRAEPEDIAALLSRWNATRSTSAARHVISSLPPPVSAAELRALVDDLRHEFGVTEPCCSAPRRRR